MEGGTGGQGRTRFGAHRLGPMLRDSRGGCMLRVTVRSPRSRIICSKRQGARG